MFKQINLFEKKSLSKELILVSFLLAVYFTAMIVFLIGTDFFTSSIPFFAYLFSSVFILVPLSFFPVKLILKASSVIYNKLYSYIILCLFNIVGLFAVISILYYSLEINYVSYIELIADYLMISVLPLFLTFYLLENSLYRNTKESYENYLKTEETESNTKQISIQSDTKQKLNIEEDKLCFIRSEQNYSNVFYLNKKEELVSVLLRVSLKKVEEQIQHNPNFVRFHNSFIVNTAYIIDISGNSKSYKLKIKHSDEEIPVSRNFSKEIIEELKRSLIAV